MKRACVFAQLVMAAVVGGGLLAATPHQARAEITINIGNPNVKPLPIAIPDFIGKGEAHRIGTQIADLVRTDLARSGFFSAMDGALLNEALSNPDTKPDYARWQTSGADALSVSGITVNADGQLSVRMRLYDVIAKKQVAGQQYTANPKQWRRIAHIIADTIHKALTGEEGYFDTAVVFVAESGPKNRRVKRLAIMDYDGANIRYLTDGADLVLTPRFSPDGQNIAYMSFNAGRPRVVQFNLATGARQVLGNYPGMTFSPRYSPDGRYIVMSLQQEGNANIYRLNRISDTTTRLTDAAAIDTAPSYSPDAAQLAFESDRGGSQQIYVMDVASANPKRISRGEGRYSTPVWSPRGDLIAFTKRHGGQFHIGVMRPDGSNERILSSGFHNEGPTWAPNGRALMFFRDIPGETGGPQLWVVNTMGSEAFRIPTPTYASDPSWSRLSR